MLKFCRHKVTQLLRVLAGCPRSRRTLRPTRGRRAIHRRRPQLLETPKRAPNRLRERTRRSRLPLQRPRRQPRTRMPRRKQRHRPQPGRRPPRPKRLMRPSKDRRRCQRPPPPPRRPIKRSPHCPLAPLAPRRRREARGSPCSPDSGHLDRLRRVIRVPATRTRNQCFREIEVLRPADLEPLCQCQVAGPAPCLPTVHPEGLP